MRIVVFVYSHQTGMQQNPYSIMAYASLLGRSDLKYNISAPTTCGVLGRVRLQFANQYQ